MQVVFWPPHTWRSMWLCTHVCFLPPISQIKPNPILLVTCHCQHTQLVKDFNVNRLWRTCFDNPGCLKACPSFVNISVFVFPIFTSNSENFIMARDWKGTLVFGNHWLIVGLLFLCFLTISNFLYPFIFSLLYLFLACAYLQLLLSVTEMPSKLSSTEKTIYARDRFLKNLHNSKPR